jgi:hypothetical protein
MLCGIYLVIMGNWALGIGRWALGIVDFIFLYCRLIIFVVFLLIIKASFVENI